MAVDVLRVLREQTCSAIFHKFGGLCCFVLEGKFYMHVEKGD